VLDVDLDEPVDAIVSTAALHWVADHDRLWARLAGALRPGGRLEMQCGGAGNVARVRGFTAIRCWLEERRTYPADVDAFVRTSILPVHLARLPDERRERFATAVVAGVSLPLDFVRLTVSAVRRRPERSSRRAATFAGTPGGSRHREQLAEGSVLSSARHTPTAVSVTCPHTHAVNRWSRLGAVEHRVLEPSRPSSSRAVRRNSSSIKT
jgi:SAM-dependent methyltransferase